MAACNSFLVIGLNTQAQETAPYDVIIADKKIEDFAQGERNGASGVLDIKHDVIASPGNHTKTVAGAFENGVFNIKGEVQISRIGGLSFPNLAAAQGWLNSPTGKYFTLRMESVAIIATAACGPELSDTDFVKRS